MYQVQIEKLSNALQKITCPSCQTFYYFGQKQADMETTEPSIERVNTIIGKIPTMNTPENTAESKEIFWRCGTCDSNYHFNMNRVTANGAKITCNTCFQYFVLQKIGNMMDLDHILTQEVSNKILLHKPSDRLQRDFLSTIDDKEVSGRFDMSALKTNEINPTTTGEHTPKTLVQPPPPKVAVKATERKPFPKLPTPEEPTQKIEFPLLHVETSGSYDLTSQKTKELNPFAKEEKSVTKKISPLPPQVITIPEKEMPKPPVVKPAKPFNDKDHELFDSFKSYHENKKKFKLDKAYEGTSISFVENIVPEKKTYLERNMVKISLWTIGISCVSFAGVTVYESIKTKRAAKQAQEAVPVPVETNTDKPKYGFPELGE